MQKRERTRKENSCFPSVGKLRYSNERSTIFDSPYLEKKYLDEENGKMIAFQISPKIKSLHGLGRRVTKL